MKKFSILAAFLFVVMISSSALAEDWVKVKTFYSYDGKYIRATEYVDKDSIKHGMKTKYSDFSPAGSFSAHVKMIKKDSRLVSIYLLGFWEKNGEKYYAILGDDNAGQGDSWLEDGNPNLVDAEKEAIRIEDDDTLYNYIKSNLP